MSSQLFDNPIHIANLLEAKGCKLAKEQRKGTQHKTLEHKAAEMIRQLVRDGYEPEALRQAKSMIECGKEHNKWLAQHCDRLASENNIYRTWAFIILIECLVWALLIALEKGVSLY